ncbi:hypothetical protein M569_07630, partial [Genlisea aurea]
MMVMALLFIFFCISFSSASASMNPDGLSLLSLKQSITSDPNRALASWNEEQVQTPCKWSGVTCHPFHGRVTSISLSGSNLSGYVPSEIGALSYLTSLDISGNSFWGTLPHRLFDLQNLRHLDVSSNDLNGSLPFGLPRLTHLTGTVNLSYNRFSGEIPASFGRLPVTVSLDISHNNLSGKIPQLGSLLNQGPTAFSGNPHLCGFPLTSPCTSPAEAQNPAFLSFPENPHVPGLPQNRKINGGMVTLILIIVSMALLAACISTWVMISRRRRKTEEEEGTKKTMGVKKTGKEERRNGRLVALDEDFALELEDLLRASAYVIGKSKTGMLYKVVLGGGASEEVVAVRRLTETEEDDDDDDDSWRQLKEVEAIARVRHPNIVKLKAYYSAGDEKLLISEFIPNGSLIDALRAAAPAKETLNWESRLIIAQGIAKGLMHIHECNLKKFIHGNLKSSKILLDRDLKPSISGFGLSPPLATKKPHISPECRDGRRLTQKSDVYSLGILLLELLTGRSPAPEGLEEAARDEIDEIIDPHLSPDIVRRKKQLVAVLRLAVSCTDKDPDSRPRMRTISEKLDCIK